MKLLVAQVDVPPQDFKFEHCDRNASMIERSKRGMQEYAERYGADYILFDEPNGSHPWLYRFELFTNYLAYDKVLYADFDVIVNKPEMNIFDECGLDDFCVATRPDGIPHNHDDLGDFNSGVICFGRNSRSHFAKWDYDRAMKFRFKDQQELNLLAKSYPHTKWIDKKWNDYTFCEDSYFHHYKGRTAKQYDDNRYEVS